MNYGFIYETTNLINGKKYIGQHRRTQNPDDPDDSWYLGSGTHISNAVNKYGEENFTRIILKECSTQEDLDMYEEYYLKLYDCENNPMYYNKSNTPWVNGYHHSERVKRLIGKNSGASRKGVELSEAHRLHISISNRGKHSNHYHPSGKDHPMYGKHHTEETRNKISNTLLCNTNRRGKICTEDSKKKMSEAQKGRVRSEEFKKKVSNSMKGVPKSDSHRENIRKSKMGDLNPATRQDVKDKIAKSLRGKVWVQNGIDHAYIEESELQSYIDKGYVRGKKIITIK